MTTAISVWLAFVLAIAAIAWFTRAAAVPFAIVAAVMLPAAFMPLGQAAPWQPAPGKHTVLGARIDVDVAIYVLLDVPGGEPRYYRLPYSVQGANALQEAMDGAGDGEGTVTMTQGDDGGPGFSEDHQPEDTEPKPVELPTIGG